MMATFPETSGNELSSIRTVAIMNEISKPLCGVRFGFSESMACYLNTQRLPIGNFLLSLTRRMADEY